MKTPCVSALRGFFYGAWLIAVMIPITATAQPPGVTMPRSAEPDVRLDQLPPTAPDKPLPDVEITESVPSRAPAGAEKVQFLLTGLQIDGVSA